MKKILKISFFSVTVIVGILLILNAYGLFAQVKMSERTVGPYVLIYSKWVGDYKVTGAVMNKVTVELKENHNIKCAQSFGLYYDNPNTVPTEKLRSLGGCVVKGKTAAELAKLNLEYPVYEFPETKSVVTEFPFKGAPSIIFGVIKVYPKLAEYLQTHRIAPSPIMELYDDANESITYISPIDISREALEGLIRNKKN